MIYCYETSNGEVVERDFPMGKAPATIRVKGRRAKRSYAAEHAGSRPAGAGWPLECLGSGVSGHQAGELRAFFKKHRFDCDVSRDGNPIYRDPNHRKRALKLRGFRENNAFC